MNLSINLRNLRRKRKLTQKELANISGIAVTQISNFECGERLPSIENLTKLKKALDCKYDEFFK